MSLNRLEAAPVETLIHGTLVSDPYRWLEDRSLQQTQDWIARTKQDFDSYFDGDPSLPRYRVQLQKLLNIEVVDQPVCVAGRYFYRRRGTKDERASLYVRNCRSTKGLRLVDADGFGPDAALELIRVSNDGSIVAFGVRHGGTDSKTVYFLRVADQALLDFRIEQCLIKSLEFMPHNRGTYYVRDNVQQGQHELVMRIFEQPDREHVLFLVERSSASRLVIGISGNRISATHFYEKAGRLVADFWLGSHDHYGPWRRLLSGRHLIFAPTLKEDSVVILEQVTADQRRLVQVTLAGEELRVLPDGRGLDIRALCVSREWLAICCARHRRQTLVIWDLANETQEILKPHRDGETIRLFPQLSAGAESFFYSAESVLVPPQIYEYSLIRKEMTLWHRQQAAAPTEAQVLSDTYVSDGAKIPITLIRGDGAWVGKPGPVVMTGYGGFGIAVVPRYSAFFSMLLGLGFTLAIPHIRGGGEFGEQWHRSGSGKNRQVAVNDFLEAARWLCAKNLAGPHGIALIGASNGGLLVATAMVQCPELFQAVIAIGPLLDMVRFEHFDRAARWTLEYGSAANKEDFEALHAGSPYHLVQDRLNYPAVLLVSGDSDERCNPAHVRKMAARLKNRHSQLSPVLVDYSELRGHKPALPVSVRIESLARRVAFLCRELGVSVDHEGQP